MDAEFPFYLELDNRGLSKNTLIEIYNWTPDDIWKLVERCSETITTKRRSSGSPFEFVVNDQLSGVPAPCWGTGCRLSNAESLGRFAALYADHVVLKHPFDRHLPQRIQFMDEEGNVTDGPSPPLHSWPRVARDHLISDLMVALFFRPLVEAGIASFSNTKSSHCAVCVYEMNRIQPAPPRPPNLEANWERKLVDIVEYVYSAYRDRTTAILDKGPTGLQVTIAGDPTLVEHGEELFTPENLEEDGFGNQPLPMPLTFEQLKRSRVLHKPIERIVNDISLLRDSSSTRIVSYLTNRPFDREVIDSIENPGQRATENHVKSIAHGLPYVDGIPLASLIEFRAAEGDAFAVYRDSLASVMREHPTATQRQLDEAFEDSIRPEINKIERSLKNTRRIAAKGIAQDAVVATGALAIGLFGGILPELMTAIGGLGAIKTAITKVPEMMRYPKEVLDNRYYFLWRAQRQSR